MRKILKAGFLLAFLSIGFFVFAASASAVLSSHANESSAANEFSAPAAKKLYQANCARCHGADGRGETEAGRLYDAPDISGGRVSRKRAETVIKNGADSMPAFGRKLSKAQISSLAEYVRKL